jgi:hypothetical protein
MADVIEGLDLTRPFVRSTLTWTGLLAAGMASGSLGLTGEDEESKRRKRLAHYYGTPLYADPRRIESDFRSADAVFLDALPGPLESIFSATPGGEAIPGQERSHVIPHWIVRQFLSPVLGIDRFLQTGDVDQIKYGFEDSFSVIPTSAYYLWNEADQTYKALKQMHAEQGSGKVGDPDGYNITRLALTAVGVYSKAFTEFQFVNQIRNASDPVDRDAYAVPDVTATGELRYMNTPYGKMPVPADELGKYVDGKEIREGYIGRTEVDAWMHGFAENNAGFAAIASLFSGQWGTDSSYLRRNMVPKIQEIDLLPANEATAEALVAAAMRGQAEQGNGIPELTADELYKKLLDDHIDSGGDWVAPEVFMRQAEAIVKKMGNQYDALSILDADGREVLTKEGAKGVLRGLRGGTVDLGAASLAGIAIDHNMRKEIEHEWVEELIQEGIDKYGLDEANAKARAKRIWYGEAWGETEKPGLGQLLYSDKIPNSGKAEYLQLNTTYVIGPDGLPWATGYSRSNWLQALGIPTPHRFMSPEGGLSVDERGNIVDNVAGINTGMRALVRLEENWKPLSEKNTESIFNKKFKPKPFEEKDSDGSGWVDFGNGWRNFGGGGSGWVDFGGGGGGGYAPNTYFTRMNPLPTVQSPYGNNTPFVNTSNPIIRRADIRRERVWSERGRLKQWQ